MPAPINSNVDNIEIEPNEPKPCTPVITRYIIANGVTNIVSIVSPIVAS